MKYFLESTWTPAERFPTTIEAWYDVVGDRTKKGHVDLYESPEFKPAIEAGDFIISGRNPLDYIRLNTDSTTSIGFWQPNKEIAQRWIAACVDRLRPNQIEYILVAQPEEGDDSNEAMLNYQQKLDSGLIVPFVNTFNP
jgi:hypothetical protein